MPPTPDLLLHPVRMRVVQALLGGRTRTTAQLRDELADVPVATLYRQIARLVDGGALEVVAEQRVRGAVERTYALRPAAVDVGPADAAGMSAEEHRAAFTAFLGGLHAGFDRFLAGGDPDGELYGYRSAAFWLTEEEQRALIADVQAALAPYRDRAEAPGRRRRHLATVLFPDPPEVTGR